MRVLLFTSLALVACNKENPEFCKTHPGEDGCPGMGSADGGTDGPEIDGDPSIDARACFGADNYEVWLTTVPSAPITLPATFDTGTANTMCLATQPAGWTTRGQPAACFVVGTNIMVSTSNVTGPRPLVLVATNNITIDGVLDVASHGGGSPKTGPGAPFSNCQQFMSPPTANVAGGAGGAGATFMSKGAAGGDGNGGMAGNSGGTAMSPLGTNPTALRGGCTGQAGAAGDGSSGGTGGIGGGAVFLLSGGTIAITQNGIVNASGAGGAAGGDQAGGGGGGSGGMIVLYANAIAAPNGRLLANGGGGASGGNNGGGNPGTDPPPTTPQLPAGTTAGPQSSGTGGSRWAINNVAVAGTAGGSGFGGAGGGGGGGFIQSNVAVDASANTSPAVTGP